jgi:hypothetical protein
MTFARAVRAMRLHGAAAIPPIVPTGTGLIAAS